MSKAKEYRLKGNAKAFQFKAGMTLDDVLAFGVIDNKTIPISGSGPGDSECLDLLEIEVDPNDPSQALIASDGDWVIKSPGAPYFVKTNEEFKEFFKEA